MPTRVHDADPARSIVEGGLFSRLEARIHVDRGSWGSISKLGIAAAGVVWIPFMAIATFERLRVGQWDPLVLRSEVHARLLVGLTLFLCAEVGLETRVGVACDHLTRSGVIPEAEMPAWERTLSRIRRLCDRKLPEISILAVVFGVTLASYFGVLPREVLRWLAPSIHEAGKGWSGQSSCWWWYVVVGQPFFLFILGRWFFRWGLWTAALASLALKNPRVYPAHADGAGGLGFLAGPLFAFQVAAMGAAVAPASIWFDEISRGNAVAETFASDFLACVGLLLLAAFSPYLGLMPLLIRAKVDAEREYSLLVVRYVDAFERRWLKARPKPEPDILGSSDFQSLADIGNSFRVVREMRFVIPSVDDLKRLFVFIVLPFGVIMLVHVVSFADLAKKVVERYLGG